MLNLLLILSAWTTLVVECTGPKVTISTGTLVGKIETGLFGCKQYRAFLGIPYAKKPGRFEYAELADPWTGERQATEFGNSCPQMQLPTFTVIGDEDCLFLNVYTPLHYSDSSKLAVIVFIHGGGFVFGSGADYGAQHYLCHDVILVTMNYRLGVLGGFFTNDSNSYGNYGLMDQRQALLWVQENIDFFGGDKHAVTLMGQSAGAASAAIQMLSPLSKGLFRRVILLSGSDLNYWAIQTHFKEYNLEIANILKCDNSSNTAIANCLKAKTFAQIVEATTNNTKVAFLFPLSWGGAVGPQGKAGFLPDTPYNILANRNIPSDVPVFMGITQTEGYTFEAALRLSISPDNIGASYFNSSEFRIQLSALYNIDPKNVIDIQRIVDHYCGGCDLNNSVVFVNILSKILSATSISVNVSRTADMLSQNGLYVIAYLYQYKGKNCYAQNFGSPCQIYSSHADDLYEHFQFLNTALTTPDDIIMAYYVTGLFASFASCKSISDLPFHRYQADDPSYIVIDKGPHNFPFPQTVYEKLSEEEEFYEGISTI